MQRAFSGVAPAPLKDKQFFILFRQGAAFLSRFLLKLLVEDNHRFHEHFPSLLDGRSGATLRARSVFCGVASALLKSFLFWQFLQRRCMTDSVDSSGFWCATLAIVTSHIHRELSCLRPICTFLMTFCAKLIINENHRFRDVFSTILGARWSHRVSTILFFSWKWYQSVDPKQESIKNILKKTPAAGGENFLIRYLGLGTSRLRYQ